MASYYSQANLRIYQVCYDNAAINPSLPAPSVPQEEKMTYQTDATDGTVYTPPPLIQRQVNLMRIYLNASDDPETFSKVIAYMYSTTTNPQPQLVIDKVSRVLNVLYTRIDKLERDNAVLHLSLEEAQDDLDMERRRNQRSQYYYS